MTITNALRDFFFSTYSGRNRERDYQIILARYLPADPTQAKITTYRDLAALPAVNVSQESCNTADEAFCLTLKQLGHAEDPSNEFVALRAELLRVSDVIAGFAGFVSLAAMRQIVGEDRSLAGVLRLGELAGLALDATTRVLGGRGYVVPSHVTQRQLEECTAVARREATRYGSVFPYERLIALPEWQFVHPEHRLRFARELLAELDGFLELGDGAFFGFSNIRRDRIRSRLIKVFSVYEEIPAANLVQALQRTLKSTVPDPRILDECTDVYDEFCVRVGYCNEGEGGQLSSSPALRELIQREPPDENDRMYASEKRLVGVLRQHGGPMDTRTFLPILRETGANLSHVMEFALLVSREGWRNNSVYRTLDDCYSGTEAIVPTNELVDRTRIEINRVNRDSRLSRRVKRLCGNRCQICGATIQIGEDSFYSEVHHVQPVGQPHNGPDKEENMLCVCPNDHVKLDYGILPLDIASLRFQDVHPIAQVYVDYHNQRIFREGTAALV